MYDVHPNPYLIQRRHFLKSTGLAAIAAFAGIKPRVLASPQITVLETKVISHLPQYYHGWPTLTQRSNGDLWLAYSGGREAHVCPFGRVEFLVSHNQGQTWGWPQVLLDSGIDDRDAGVMETAHGTLLVTTFSSLAYEPILAGAVRKKADAPGAWPKERLQAWQAAHLRLSAEQRQAELGQWMLRSTDGGVSWSARYASIVNSPHGPIQLADGHLLYAGKELWTGQGRAGVCESLDDGQTWQWLSEIPVLPGHSAEHYHELHAVETNQGRIILQIRNENGRYGNETLQTDSTDGGRHWAMPRSIGVWGLPSFLLRLRNGHLLMTYGYRRPPFGNQARLSTDQGQTWSEPVTLSRDGIGSDLGYPSTVELPDGTLLTAWYEVLKDSPRAVLRQAWWRWAA